MSYQNDFQGFSDVWCKQSPVLTFPIGYKREQQSESADTHPGVSSTVVQASHPSMSMFPDTTHTNLCSFGIFGTKDIGQKVWTNQHL